MPKSAKSLFDYKGDGLIVTRDGRRYTRLDELTSTEDESTGSYTADGRLIRSVEDVWDELDGDQGVYSAEDLLKMGVEPESGTPTVKLRKRTNYRR